MLPLQCNIANKPASRQGATEPTYQRGHHNHQAALHDCRQCIAQGLASACWHEHKGITACMHHQQANDKQKRKENWHTAASKLQRQLTADAASCRHGIQVQAAPNVQCSAAASCTKSKIAAAGQTLATCAGQHTCWCLCSCRCASCLQACMGKVGACRTRSTMLAEQLSAHDASSRPCNFTGDV
jgi:hypothetical protein